MELAYFLEGGGAFVGVPEELSAELAFDLVDFGLCEEGDWDAGLEDLALFLEVGGPVDIDEGVVMALIGEVAGALAVDIFVDLGEFGADVGHVVVVAVDDVVGLLDDVEELGQFGDDVLVEGLLDPVQVVAPRYQDAYRVNILFPLIGFIRLLVFAQQRLHNQEVFLLELQRQQTPAQLLPRQYQVRTQVELLLRQHRHLGHALHQLETGLVMELAQTHPQNLHLIIRLNRGHSLNSRYHAHLTKLNTPMPTQSRETKGLRRSPMTAALRMMPRKPVL